MTLDDADDRAPTSLLRPLRAVCVEWSKWAVFLLGLKSLVETGKGAPDPNDIKIDNWN
jgi:hypothetical protein